MNCNHTNPRQSTFNRLNLNHLALVNDRVAIMKQALTPRRDKPFSVMAARAFAERAEQRGFGAGGRDENRLG